MNHFVILTKRELKQQFGWYHQKQRSNYLGKILSVLIAVSLLVIFMMIFYAFVKGYATIPFKGELIKEERYFEILTLAYAAVIIAGIINGTMKITKSFMNDESMKILIKLPVDAKSIFWSKFVVLYLHEVLFSVLTILPIHIAYATIVHPNAIFWLMTILHFIFIPLIELIFASILVVPFAKIVSFLKNKYLLTIIIFIVGITIFFGLYIRLINIFKSLFETGSIQFVFNEQVITTIRTLSKWAYPANLFANATLFNKGIFPFIWLFLILSIGFLIAYFIIKVLFNQVLRYGLKADKGLKKQTKIKKTKPFMALLKKEFLMVWRSPNYLFQYFVMAFVMPIMVFSCLFVFSKFMTKMIGDEWNVELTVFIIAMFSVLTNVFCATNISREGKMFNLSKRLPYPYHKQLLSKVCFCAIVSYLSLIVSLIIVLALNYINFFEMLLILVAMLLLITGEILIATRKDLNRPSFDELEKGEVNNENSTVSFIIGTGLLMAIFIGVSCFLISFITNGKKLFGDNGGHSPYVALLCVILICLIYCGLACFYFFKNVIKKYHETVY